jgi:hypothetical protein
VEGTDRGIWMTWYNLPEQGRDDYLAWLHGHYMPSMLKQPGYLWGAHFASETNVKMTGAPNRLGHVNDASIPIGDRYILLFGAKDAHVFVNPTPAQMRARLSDADKKMLALRIGERYNIATEEARIHGPEDNTAKFPPQLGLAGGIQLGSFNAGVGQDEDELAAWYAQWRMPCMQKLPGCVRVRKYASVSGWAKHMILYEFLSTRARDGSFVEHEKVNPKMEQWTDDVVRKLVHAPGSPNLAARIWPAVG